MLRFVDSFDHYATADFGLKYDTVDTVAIAVGSGRLGGNALNTTAWQRGLYKLFTANDTWIVGFGLRMNSSLGVIVCGWQDTVGGATQVELRMDGSGRLYVTRNGTTVAGPNVTDPIALTLNTWYWIEWRVTIHNSAGETEVRVNGVSQFTATALDTQNTATASANQFRICDDGGVGGTQTVLFDDLYICDGDGGSPTNDFLGELRVECLFPNGNGTTSDLDGSDGNSTDNHLLVDETAQDGDTTYVEGSGAGDRDTYAYTNLTPTSGTVYGVQAIPCAKKTDTGARSVVAVSRESGGTEEDGDAALLTSAYKYYPQIFELDPDAATWTISSVNAAEFGVKVA